MRKRVQILNPSKSVFWFYGNKIDAGVTTHWLTDDEVRFLRFYGFIISYNSPVKLTKTIIIE